MRVKIKKRKANWMWVWDRYKGTKLKRIVLFEGRSGLCTAVMECDERDYLDGRGYMVVYWKHCETIKKPFSFSDLTPIMSDVELDYQLHMLRHELNIAEVMLMGGGDVETRVRIIGS